MWKLAYLANKFFNDSTSLLTLALHLLYETKKSTPQTSCVKCDMLAADDARETTQLDKNDPEKAFTNAI